VLTLCRSAGVALESEVLEETVQEWIDSHIENDLEGDRSAYLEELKANGTTDHYLRFLRRVDSLYASLKRQYVAQGILPSGEEEMRSLIHNEFIRTCHIMILNENHSEANLKKAEEALALIENGEPMYKMIGSKYNQDFGLTTYDGYYFTRGLMDEAYEKAAYALDVKEKSGIVAAKGENSVGRSVDCYYIIQRLPLEETYIDSHFDELCDMHYESQIYMRVQEVEKNLHFVPNAYGQGLTLTELDMPEESDPMVWITALIVTGSVLSVGAVVCVVILLIRRRKKNILARAEKLHVERKS
jgi:hypothetical protein